ncbi:MAG TPA: hypothetical protein VH415_02260 [Nitrososphaeraceae archaeon]|jgi:hypothetical protein
MVNLEVSFTKKHIEASPVLCIALQCAHTSNIIVQVSYPMGRLCVRDKKILIWNFMEELVDRHQQALTTRQVFDVQSFKATRLPILKQTDQFLLRVLGEYGETKGYFSIQGNTVSLTDKGIACTERLRHDWD